MMKKCSWLLWGFLMGVVILMLYPNVAMAIALAAASGYIIAVVKDDIKRLVFTGIAVGLVWMIFWTHLMNP
jgi:hypothetical protein